MPAGRRTVVYIEDNATNLELVTRILEATGRFRVVGAVDGATGLAAVERERPVLVLVDLDIPVVNGFEVARRLKGSADTALATTPIIAVSANVLKGERQASMEAGCESFIEKPFDIHEFRREIERILGP